MWETEAGAWALGPQQGQEEVRKARCRRCKVKTHPFLGLASAGGPESGDPGHLACPTSVPDPPRSVHFHVSLILVVGNLLVLPGCAL